MDDRTHSQTFARAKAGDQEAFAGLVESYRRELHVHCYRMLGSFDEAEDLVQETFLRAWQGREGFRGGPGFRAWLYRIATNACLDFLSLHPRPLLTAAGRERGRSQRSARSPDGERPRCSDP